MSVCQHGQVHRQGQPEIRVRALGREGQPHLHRQTGQQMRAANVRSTSRRTIKRALILSTCLSELIHLSRTSVFRYLCLVVMYESILCAYPGVFLDYMFI